MNPDENQKLERLIHRALRDLPARRAPQSLEMRVLAAIEQRAALPWWRKSFAYWPQPARAAFVMLSFGLAVAAVWLMAGVDFARIQAPMAAALSWFSTFSLLTTKAAEFAQLVVRSIPPLWLYGGLAVAGGMYAAFFGLGAAAYRTLYASR